MDARLGLKVSFIDPENPANIITAQFATVRGHGEMKSLMEACAKAEVAETIAIKRWSLACDALASADTSDCIDEAAAAIEKADDVRRAAGEALVDAVHAFVVRGFELAGATGDLAERLASLVGPEQLADLRLKCAFGAGVVDFTKAADR